MGINSGTINGVISAVGEFLKLKAVDAGVMNPDGSANHGGIVKKGTVLAWNASKVGGAITGVTSQLTIMSRVFLDENVTDEIVLPNLMRSIHEWYAAQIIAALNLGRLVTNKERVQDVLSVVSSGNNSRMGDLIDNKIGRMAGFESFVGNYLGEAGLESVSDPIFPTGYTGKDDQVVQQPKGKSVVQEIQSVKVGDNRIGPMGELYEITMTNPDNPNAVIKVPLFIQMQPSIIPASVAARFIDMNVTPSQWHRWTMMKAGEMSFFKDFLGYQDVARRNKSFIKDPEAAKAFSDFQKTISMKNRYALGDMVNVKGRSENLANSVIIFSEETVAQAKIDAHIDLHNAADRRRYFQETFTMIVGVVDTIHQRITIYFNGIDGAINAGYQDFKPRDTKFDPKDFMQALTAFTTGSVGRGR